MIGHKVQIFIIRNRENKSIRRILMIVINDNRSLSIIRQVIEVYQISRYYYLLPTYQYIETC